MPTTSFDAIGLTPNDIGETLPSVTTSFDAIGITPDDKAIVGGQYLPQAGMTGLQSYFFNTQMNGGMNG